MTRNFSDRVKETSSTTGTGDVTLLGAVSAYEAFSANYAVDADDQFYYTIAGSTGTEWEVGIGHLSASATLVRDTVLSSSNSDSLVSFSAGTKNVINTIPASFLNNVGSPDYGAGVDGALVFDGSATVTLLGGQTIVPSAGVYTLPRDIWALSVEIQVTATISNANGFVIFCTGNTLLDGVIKCTGTAGAAGAAGAGGAAGVAAINVGGPGRYCDTGGGAIGGSAGSAGTAATYNPNATCKTRGIAAGSAAGVSGGTLQGGGGGNGEGGAGGATPSVTPTANALSAGPYNLIDALTGRSAGSNLTSAFGLTWSTGMGGGGGAGGTAIIGGGGGGGGAPGGVVCLVSRTISGSGSIDVRGAAGGNGQVGGSCNTGGGGGGSGGLAITVTESEYPLSISVLITGGAGGTKNGTGVNGGAGGTGIHVQY